MKLNTKFLGEVEIQDEAIISFPNGLWGFRETQKFVLLPLDADVPLVILQSIEDQNIGFILAYPFAFKNDYAFDISEEDKMELAIEEEQDVLAYAIVTMKESFQASTLNLLAPVIINMKDKIGKQIILQDNAQYPIRFPMNSLEGSAK